MNKVLVVLGKNVGYLGSRKNIIKSANFLSRKSELSVLAAGILSKKCGFNTIIFSGGKTVGKDYPSEAKAMLDFFLKTYSSQNLNIILEDKSMDTKQNVQYLKQILDKKDIHEFSFLTTSPHIRRSKMLFNRYGLFPTSYSSEEIVNDANPDLFLKYKNEFGKSEKYLEMYAYILQSIPVVNSIGDFITEKRRGLN